MLSPALSALIKSFELERNAISKKECIVFARRRLGGEMYSSHSIAEMAQCVRGNEFLARGEHCAQKGTPALAGDWGFHLFLLEIYALLSPTNP